MRHLILGLTLTVLATASASAQEFRIVTTVRDLSASDGAAADASTLTLFRQNKVYDYIHALGEVIIYEPGANQFVILNVRRSIATTVNFDEVKKLLQSREPEIQRYIKRLRSQGDETAAEAAAAFEFQLHPNFEESFDATTKTLQLSSPTCTYTVRCTDAVAPEHVTQYLAYADWMARLNSVLHPQAMFPEPRLKLNASLRRHRRMPIRVELSYREGGHDRGFRDHALHLAAEHRISLKLEKRDRSQITAWENALASPRTTRTTFRGYQEAVLAAR